MVQLNLTKEQSIQQIDLRKNKIQLIVSKTPKLNGAKARTALVLDFSGSTKPDYMDGTIQAIIERIYPLAAVFDDNAEMDLWIFHEGFYRIGTVTKDNFYGIVKSIMEKYQFGGTKYAPVMKDIAKMYIEEKPEKIAEYIVFLTDGKCWDEDATKKLIKEYSHWPMFWQFIGYSSREKKFGFLEELDNMEDRYLDNANFFRVKDINAMSDDDLYDLLLKEFPDWLGNPKVQEMIAQQVPGQKLHMETAEGRNGTGKKKKGLFGLFG